jgi:hypothetical protein
MAEDPALFAANLMKLSEEKHIMKLSRKPVRILLAVAIVAILGGTAYAATALNLFSFQSGDRFVMVRTNDDMTEEEAREMAAEDQEASDLPEAERNVIIPEEIAFASAEEAETDLDMEIAMPSAMPEVNLDNIVGSVSDFGGGVETRTAWLNYSDEAGRMFGITVARHVAPNGLPVTSYTTTDIDEGSLGSYISQSGVEYTTLTESNPDDPSQTAHIATAMVGEYEYALVFFGFDEAEMHTIMDSADLSVYEE